MTAICLATDTGVAKAETDIRKPAVLFLSLPMQMHYGGAFMRRNLKRLHEQGYRIAYATYPEIYDRGADVIRTFDVVVLLDQPGIDSEGTQALRLETTAMYSSIRALLGAGSGLIVFSWSFVSHTFLGVGEMGMHNVKLPGEA